MDKEKMEIMEDIKKKEAQLVSVSRDMESWNGGKHKSQGNAQHSRQLAESLKKDIAALQAKLEA